EPYFQDSMSEYLPIYIENNTVNGRLLAIPFTLSAGILLYRSDLLEKYGLKPPETWADLQTAAQKIQDGERAINKDFWGYVVQGKAYEGLTCNALEWIASHNGGTILEPRTGRVLINSTNVAEALNMAAGWIGK